MKIFCGVAFLAFLAMSCVDAQLDFSSIGIACTTASECVSAYMTEGMVCQKVATGCTKGTCMCPFNYVNGTVSGTHKCLAYKKVGEACDTNTDKCYSTATCTGSPKVCTCPSGYKRDEAASSCIDSSSKAKGESCTLRSQCQGDLGFYADCISSVCTCQAGYKYNEDSKIPSWKKCIMKNIGDACTSNNDCTHYGGTCSNNVCACTNSDTKQSTNKQGASVQYVCTNVNATFDVMTNGKCKPGMDDTTKHCGSGLECIKCMSEIDAKCAASSQVWGALYPGAAASLSLMTPIKCILVAVFSIILYYK